MPASLPGRWDHNPLATMIRRLPFLLSFSALLAGTAQAQKFEGLALTPPMGWNTWNTFGVNCSEALVKQTADAMIANGMRDAGYVYLVIDDAWSAKERDSAGTQSEEHTSELQSPCNLVCRLL